MGSQFKKVVFKTGNGHDPGYLRVNRWQRTIWLVWLEEPMNNIQVRFAKLQDLPFVSQDGFIPPEVVIRKIEVQEVVLAEIEGQPVGYLRLEYLWSLVPYIALVTVEPPHRRIGVGQAMLAFVNQFLADADHEWLYSSSQADEPEPQAWHRHMGFQDCGIITGINAGGVSEVFFKKAVC